MYLGVKPLVMIVAVTGELNASGVVAVIVAAIVIAIAIAIAIVSQWSFVLVLLVCHTKHGRVSGLQICKTGLEFCPEGFLWKALWKKTNDALTQ